MRCTKPTALDDELVRAAQNAIRSRYRAGRHVVGAALRTRSGHIFTGVHLETSLSRAAICAEAIALGRAATEAGDTDIETIVAVCHPEPGEKDQSISVVAPCGICREMIADYSPTARVIIPAADNGTKTTTIAELLPERTL